MQPFSSFSAEWIATEEVGFIRFGDSHVLSGGDCTMLIAQPMWFSSCGVCCICVVPLYIVKKGLTRIERKYTTTYTASTTESTILRLQGKK